MRQALLLVICLAGTAHAQDTGSPARGETLAREVCAACHAVARGDTSPLAAATPLPDVADLVSTTRQSLFVFLNTPHATMPDLVLAPAETDDLIAYILSLRGG